uniref:DUF1639 family protein n=1 Tax=Lotus japonicus TaxID=34305 RepID=I3SXI3_LOTJA|nr:unknown [Lotus japonicus]
MAMIPERSKPPLHNFSLPCLKWGTQRLLRCVNADPPSSSSPDRRSDPAPRLPSRKTDDTTVDAVREKIMGDLRVAAKKLKVSIFEDDGVGGGGTAAANAAAARPWNLRTRRAACKAPVTGPPPRDEERRFFEVGCSSPSPAKDKDKDKDKNKKKMVMDEKIKFSVSLSKEEVEQDFWALAGTRPPRRPKKRPRNVQKQLTTLYPGLWLSELTADSYKVADVPE